MSFMPERLKELREQNGYSLRDLAAICNTSKSAIFMYETGKRNPKQEALENMARALKCDIDYLTGKSDNPLSLEPIEEILGRLSEKERILFDMLKKLPVDKLEEVMEEIIFKLNEEE